MTKDKGQITNFLKTTRLFRDLEAEQLEAIASVVRLQQYDKGKMLFWQGDRGTGFFLVRSGKVKVFQLSGGGKEQILGLFEAGEYFAEVPALDGGCFPASAATLEKTEIVFFPREAFLKLLENQPAIAINLLSAFARHLRQFAKIIENLSLREVPGRLAAYLLDRSISENNSDIITLDISKGQLAAFVGTIPETLSRSFNKLVQEDLILREGNEIKIRDRASLKQRAGRV